MDPEQLGLKKLRKTKNPIIVLGTYAFIVMVLGIACTWVLLGILSPVLLILLIQRW